MVSSHSNPRQPDSWPRAPPHRGGPVWFRSVRYDRRPHVPRDRREDPVADRHRAGRRSAKAWRRS